MKQFLYRSTCSLEAVDWEADEEQADPYRRHAGRLDSGIEKVEKWMDC